VRLTSWSLFTRRMIVLLFLVTIVIVFWMVRTVMTALLLSAFFAFLMTPPVNYLQRRLGMPRFLGALLIMLLVLGLFALILIIFIPIIIAQFSAIRFSFTDSLGGSFEWLRAFLDNFNTVFGYDLSPYIRDIQDQLTVARVQELIPAPDEVFGSGRGLLRASTGTLASVATTVGGFLFTLVLVFVFTIYLINDMPVLSRAVGELVPERERPELEDLKHRLKGVWYSFVRGNVLLMLAFGVLVGLSMFALGVPSALVLGIIAGLMDLVPTVGAFFAGSIIILMALLQGSSWLEINNFVFALIVIGVYMFLQWVEGNILQPKIMGGSVNLPGFVAIVGIVVGLAVGGILGAYLAIPIIASAREIFIYFYKKLTQYPAEGAGAVVRTGPINDRTTPEAWLTEQRNWSLAASGGRYLVEPHPVTEAVDSGLLLPETLSLGLDDVELHVANWPGAEPALLCIPGLTANAYAFGGLGFTLSPRHRVTAFDLRGRGRSRGGSGKHGVRQHARDALGVMDRLGLEKPVLVGHSLGALAALALAAEHPERVAALVLIDGGGPVPREIVDLLESAPDEIRREAGSFEEYIQPVKTSGIFEEWNFFIEYFYRMEVEEAPGVTRSRTSPEAVEADVADLRTLDPRPWAEKLRVPTLVLRAGQGMPGSGLQMMTEEEGNRLAEATPFGRLISKPKATHSSILYNRYPELAEDIERFLGEVLPKTDASAAARDSADTN